MRDPANQQAKRVGKVMGRVRQERDRMRRDAVKHLNPDKSEIQKGGDGKGRTKTCGRVAVTETGMMAVPMIVVVAVVMIVMI